MLRCMRTTVRLDEDLLHEVKRVAAEERTTLTALLEEALRSCSRAVGRAAHGAGYRSPRMRGGGYSRAWTSTTPRRCSISWTAAMLLVDVNVLVYAFRVDAPDHAAYRRWLESVIAGPSPFGLADVVLSGFLRIV